MPIVWLPALAVMVARMVARMVDRMVDRTLAVLGRRLRGEIAATEAYLRALDWSLKLR